MLINIYIDNKYKFIPLKTNRGMFLLDKTLALLQTNLDWYPDQMHHMVNHYQSLTDHYDKGTNLHETHSIKQFEFEMLFKLLLFFKTIIQ